MTWKEYETGPKGWLAIRTAAYTVELILQGNPEAIQIGPRGMILQAISATIPFDESSDSPSHADQSCHLSCDLHYRLEQLRW
jgi:hypothetical protein